VLIASHHSGFDNILAANVRCWGYDVIMLPCTIALDSHSDVEADVLLYDLDEYFRMALLVSGKDSPILPTSLAAEYTYGMIRNCAEQWPRVRLTIALSSRSISRATLEHIGAVICLQKPFEMGRLQHYLRVLQRLLLEPAEPQHQSEQRRILVVDDDITIANAIRDYILFQSEYKVKVAYDGLEALELYLDWRPHCIVTDLIMPRMNGYQFIQCLAARVQPIMPAFVITSALTQFEEPAHHPYLQGKMVTYINKPFSIHHLLTVIEQACMESV
jgi:two-component system alkaline phosphatase synthesis response regulator PhoP